MEIQINRRDFFFALLIFLLALTLRLLYLLDYKATLAFPVYPGSDGYSYYLWARDIACGDFGSQAFMKWPFYAYFLALLFKFSGSSIVFAYSVQFVLGAANCVLISLTARKIFNSWVGLIAGLFCAAYAPFIFYDNLLTYTTLSLFLNSLLFLLIIRVKDNPGIKNLFWIGFLGGIAAITQANVLLFAVPAVIFILWQKRAAAAKFFACILSFGLGLCIVIGTVTVRNYLAERDFVPIAGNIGLIFYLGNNIQAQGTYYYPRFLSPNQEGMFRDAKVIARMTSGKELKTSGTSAFWFRKGLDFIRSHPKKFIKLCGRKFLYLFGPEEMIHDSEYQLVEQKIRIFKFLFIDLRFLLPFALLGILLGLRNFREQFLLFLALGGLSLTVLVFFFTTRYRIGIVPFLIIFSASGIYGILKALFEKRFASCAFFIFASALFFGIFNYSAAIVRAGYTPAIGSDLSYLDKALERERDSQYSEEIEILNAADKQDPFNHLVKFHLGVAYLGLRESKEAEDNLKKAIDIAPYYLDAYYDLGFLYNEEGRFAEARAFLEKVIYLDSEDTSAHFELGRAYKGLGDIARAKREFKFTLKKLSCWRVESREKVLAELKSLNKEGEESK